MTRVYKWLVLGPTLLVVAGAIFAALRIATYSQEDDARRVEAKRAYLRQIEETLAQPARPNVVLILLDDLGYADLGAFGSRSIATPHIDALAEGGAKLTHYYSPGTQCSPSRAGMLTGRYPLRAGVPQVLFPDGHPIKAIQRLGGARVRIPAEEILLPEVLRAAGYRTGMVGKWHLGDVSPSLPNDLGFEHFFGALYSNDMKPFALYRDREVAVEAPADQATLHTRYTQAAVDFIESAAGAAGGERAQEAPFFLYYAHTFPHIPLYSSSSRRGTSRAGLYGDVVEDIDASVGKVVAALERRGLLEETLILLTSDNGPWFEGSPGGVRGRKNQTWEGGMRVPFIAHWPGRIASGRTIDAPVSGIDLFPTLLALLDLPPPLDRAIDGADVFGVLAGEDQPSERLLYYFNGERLDAVRDARFKYHRRRGVRVIGVGDWLSLSLPQGPWLIDLGLDSDESYDASRHRPRELERLRAAFEVAEAEFAENLRGWRDP